MRAAVIAALFAGVAMGSANAAYNVGDVLSAEDRATNFTACDGTTHTLGSFLDAGKTLVIDKSAYSWGVCNSQAPFYHEFAKNNQAENVQYLSLMLFSIDSAQSTCTAWGKKGLDEGEENTYTITLNDKNDPGKLGVWFGATRPQYMLVDSSGKFKDMSPNPQGGCVGPCGIWDSQRYASLLAAEVVEGTPTATPSATTPTPSAPGGGRTYPSTSTAADKGVYKALVSGVVFLAVTLALCVQL